MTMHRSRRSSLSAWLSAATLGAGCLVGYATFAADDANSHGKDSKRWVIHDRSRPKPEAITPATASTQDQVGKAPSDAVVLFDGSDLSHWTNDTWKVEDSVMVVGKGMSQSKDEFGDCQLHVEWMAPNPPHGQDQDRGNSGVFLMGQFEVQVLDSYQADTYPDGQAAAVYGQYPPEVNASRPPGQWQTYDIVFHRARFAEDGKLEKKATITVIHNGVLVQDHVEIQGPTGHHMIGDYKKGPEKAPIAIQDHNHPVKYRNIWVRPLEKFDGIMPSIRETK